MHQYSIVPTSEFLPRLSGRLCDERKKKKKYGNATSLQVAVERGQRDLTVSTSRQRSSVFCRYAHASVLRCQYVCVPACLRVVSVRVEEWAFLGIPGVRRVGLGLRTLPGSLGD